MGLLGPLSAPAEVMRKSVDLVQPRGRTWGGGCWVLGLWPVPGREGPEVPAHDWPLGTCPEGHPHVPGKEGGCPRVHRGMCRSHSCIQGNSHRHRHIHGITTGVLHVHPDTWATHTRAHAPVAPEPPDAQCEHQAPGIPSGETRAAGPFLHSPGDPVRGLWLRASLAAWDPGGVGEGAVTTHCRR